jgi:hypothetical protein
VDDYYRANNRRWRESARLPATVFVLDAETGQIGLRRTLPSGEEVYSAPVVYGGDIYLGGGGETVVGHLQRCVRHDLRQARPNAHVGDHLGGCLALCYDQMRMWATISEVVWPYATTVRCCLAALIPFYELERLDQLLATSKMLTNPLTLLFSHQRSSPWWNALPMF